MKKVLLAVALGFGVLVASGCSSCTSDTCGATPEAPECDRCTTEYCEYIGTRIYDERVLKSEGKDVKFEDGTIIRTLPKSKITKW